MKARCALKDIGVEGSGIKPHSTSQRPHKIGMSSGHYCCMFKTAQLWINISAIIVLGAFQDSTANFVP